ncbi:3'-5' exonuclease [Marinobacter algicola]|nr:3'-5' exonuclease [Marinobacter algicola]
MRCLTRVQPTAEQLKIVSRIKPGVEVVRGAAGSGKTTTAILRLKSLIGMYKNLRRRAGSDEPVRVLVLTYNRTLRGYISQLVGEQTKDAADVTVEISTFGKWARAICGPVDIASSDEIFTAIARSSNGVDLPNDYLVSEIEYLLGRFKPENLDEYLTARREGRGIAPRVERQTREQILTTVIPEYRRWLSDHDKIDWNDLAVSVANTDQNLFYDVLIVDEAQDFSANQIRALLSYAHDRSSTTFVLDTVQRIYSRGYSWREVGVTVRPENSITLENNYRNTRQIAALAAGLLDNVPTDDDSAMPDFDASEKEGDMPVLLVGKYSSQLENALEFIRNRVDLRSQSVAFLHPKGGGWFQYLRGRLNAQDFEYTEITRMSEWPSGNENIALCTLHSAKGLEFDHVFVLGINDEVMPSWEDENDDRMILSRKLLAMAVGRAKISVTLGYKKDDASQIIEYIKPNTVSVREV